MDDRVFERQWYETAGRPFLDRVLAMGGDPKEVVHQLGKLHPRHARHYFARFHIDWKRRYGLAFSGTLSAATTASP